MQGAFDKLAQLRPVLAKGPATVCHEDGFLKAADLAAAGRRTVLRRERMARTEVDELTREKNWQAILDLFYPVADKQPELVQQWRNVCAEALFWQALSACRNGEVGVARQVAAELQAYRPDYPKLDRLLTLLQENGGVHALDN